MVLESVRNFIRKRHGAANSFDVTLAPTSKQNVNEVKMRRYHGPCDDYPVESRSACVRLTAVRKIPSRDLGEIENTSINASSSTQLQKPNGNALLCEKVTSANIHSKLPRFARFVNELENEPKQQTDANESPSEDSIGEHFEIEHLKTAFRAASNGDTIALSTSICKLGIPVDTETLKGVSMLQLAITGDHLNAVKLLIDLGANIYKATARGRTPLLTAARYGAAHSMKFLLQLLCCEEKNRLKNLNVKTISDENAYNFLLVLDENGDSALHLACRGMDDECVKILLRVLISTVGWQVAEKLLNQTNERGYAPIHVACMWRSVAVVRLLLTCECRRAIAKVCPFGRTKRIANALRRASLGALNNNLQTGSVLHEMACSKACSRCACETVVQPIVEVGSPLNWIQGLPSSIVAEYEEDDMDLPDRKCIDCEKRAKEVVKLVVKGCPQLLNARSELGLTPLMSAVSRDALGIVEALIQLKVDLEAVDGQGRTAMHHAASRGLSRQVAILLSWGASPCRPDFECNQPMHYASVKGHTASLRLLYKANKYIDVASPSGHTAFMWAAMRGCDASLRTMLNANPLLSRHDRDNESNTALHLAAKRDLPSTVKLLVSAGWETEDKNNRGESAFLSAAANGSSNAMRVLLTYGADMFALDKDGNSAVHLSSRSDYNRDALRELLAWLTEPRLVNLRNNEGRTPLHIAVENCCVKCVRELLKNGADIRARDLRGWDCLMVATKASNQRSWPILTLMIKHSPNVNGYSPVDNVSTLSLAQASHNQLLVAYLKMHGAMLPFEIIDRAARRIQRWYRKKLFMRQLLRQPYRKGRRVRQACASLGADMIEAGAQIPSLYFTELVNFP